MDSPRMQWIIFEDLENGEYDLRVIAQDAQGFLRTTLENPLRTGCAHAVDHISRHTERDVFWDCE